ncbi:hypothetical protein GCM10027605_43730 [Micromonospora zhanjiangensis]
MTGRHPEIEPYDRGLLDVGDGHFVHWETCGNPDGKPAVVLHGGPGSGCTPAGAATSTRSPTGSCCSTSATAAAARRTRASPPWTCPPTPPTT